LRRLAQVLATATLDVDGNDVDGPGVDGKAP
jgi:hypothetical protein